MLTGFEQSDYNRLDSMLFKMEVEDFRLELLSTQPLAKDDCGECGRSHLEPKIAFNV